MFGLSKGERDVLVLVTALKILLFPAYRSTDFEVHRNWLAITHNLPLKEWYLDDTSQWTLDYPPFFAYFSYLLGLPARLLPHQISATVLNLSLLPMEGWEVTGYMRMTVLVSELMLFLATLRLSRGSSAPTRMISLAIALHPGFLILDNIHFQYNAFLFGVMIWSLVGAKEPLLCAGAFAALLNFKHIYMYFAPAWFIYLFRAYCLKPEDGLMLRLAPLSRIGAVTVLVFAISIGPFIAMGQGQQLLARLFPFTRGLNHAYWAPNAWAGVTLLDRILLQVAKRFHLPLPVSASGIASTSRGLVGDTNFAILPDIQPLHCFLITAITQIVQLVPLWRRPSYQNFLRAITACGFSSFMFGWHVHEKAVMLILVPLSLLASQDWNHFQAFIVASVPGLIGLFPLLFNAHETQVKMGYTLIWMIVVFSTVRKQVSRPEPNILNFTVDSAQTLYLATIPALLLYTSLLHPLLTKANYIPESMEFLPLMMTSVWCSLGLWFAWGRLTWSLVIDYSSSSGSGNVPEVVLSRVDGTREKEWIDRNMLLGIKDRIQRHRLGMVLMSAFISRLAISQTGIPNLLRSRPELSSPITSFRSLKEGLFILSKGSNPYDGGVFYHSPVYLALFSGLDSSGIVWITADIVAAFALTRIAAIRNATIHESLVAGLYLFNPYTTMTCLAKSTTALDNCFLVLAILGQANDNYLLSGVALAIVTQTALYPILLLAPMMMGSKHRKRLLTSYLVSSALVITANSMLFGSTWLRSSWGTILTVQDLTPNVGMWWYFFTEMFDHFRLFFLGVFQIHVAIYTVPVCLRVKDPLFATVILLGIISTWKSYPTLGDLAVWAGVLGCFPDVIKNLRHPLFALTVYLYTLILLPLLHSLWLLTGTGNANFFYAATMVHGLNSCLAVVDVLTAGMRLDIKQTIGDAWKEDYVPVQFTGIE